MQPLDEQVSLSLAKTRLGQVDLPPEVEAALLERSAGNPFYIEEITYSLIEQEVLITEQVQEGVEVWLVNPSSQEIDLPDSIHGMVQTRIDKLEEEAHKLLLEASVVGMEFNVDFLKELHARAGGDTFRAYPRPVPLVRKKFSKTSAASRKWIKYSLFKRSRSA